MRSLKLKKSIEEYLCDQKIRNRFFVRLEQGELGPVNIATLLESTRYLLTQTPVHLMIAVKEAQARPDIPELVPYLNHHIAEEVNHDQWAAQDLQQLQALSSTTLPEKVCPSMVRLVQYVRGLVETDPVLFIPYILFAEYLSVIAVPETVRLLEAKCAIPPRVMSVFTQHAELDKDHANEDCEIIDLILERSPVYEQPMRNVIRYSGAIYSSFLGEVADAVAP